MPALGLPAWNRSIVLRQATRLLVSIGVSEIMAGVLHLRDPGWALITSAVVTQTTIGETYSNGRNQFLGALIGGVASLIAISAHLVGVPQDIAFWSMLVPLAILSAWRPATRLGTVTLMIAMLFPSDTSPFEVPIQRVLCVLTGVVVAMGVSFTILHEQVRRAAFRDAAVMVRGIRTILTTATHDNIGWPEVRSLSDTCTDALRRVLASVDEARRESLRPLDERDPLLVALPSTLRQLQTDAMVVARAAIANPAHKIANMHMLEQGLSEALDWIATRCEAEADGKVDHTVSPDQVLAGLPQDTIVNDPVWLFVLRILRTDIGDFIRFLTRPNHATT